MIDPSAPSAQGRITAIVAKILAPRLKLRRPEPDEDLRKAGLSSLDMVKVVLSLEQEFQVAIPEPAVTPKNFRSIASIEALMATLSVDALPG